MRLSIRTKVLTTYVALAVMVLAILGVGLLRLKRIGAHLNAIQTAYLPLVKTVNSYFTFYHLDETFDVQKLLANRNNRLFIDSITIANPQLLEYGIHRQIEEAGKNLETYSPDEKEHVSRLHEIGEDLITQHRKYLAMISAILNTAREQGPIKAASRNDELVQQKRLVRSRIDLLSKRLDDYLRSAIRSTIIEERKAVFGTVGLSVATLLLATLIGIMSLLILRPLEKLKRVTREIAAGDFTQRAEISSDDEVGDLGKEFNRMADSIEQRDEALHRQQEQLIQSEKMAVVGRMASKISHEVKNPLNALSLNVEMLQDEVKNPGPKKILDAMTHEIERLNNVAENYLSMSRSKKPSMEETDLNAMVVNLQNLVRAECERRKIRLQVDTEAQIPKIKIDSTRMEQAVLNLLKNALEAVSEGGRLGIKTSRQNGKIFIDVWDEGKGMSREVLSHIFEPFYTTKEKGTGLGLSITNEIIRDQGGTIECESNVGSGTRFRIALLC